VLEHGLDKNPSYGFYSDVSLENILAKIDWVINNQYLEIEYDYRLPLLVYSDKGWEIERDTYSTELLEGFNKMIESGKQNFNMNYLKDRNRSMILILLDKVQAVNDMKYIPLLLAWKEIDYKKIREKIDSVIANIKRNQDRFT